DDGRALCLRRLRGEAAPDGEFDAERLKQFGRNSETVEGFGRVVACERGEGVEVSGGAGENCLLRAPIGEVKIRGVLARRVGLRVCAPDVDERRRLNYRQRAQQDCVDDREERRVCADAKRDGDERNEREAGRLPQHAPTVAYVLP